jgi:DNA invertase Pin-like site-specific DNA recombinase
MEDAVQMFSCLLKNRYEVHFVKQSVIISKESDVMLVLGLIDQLRQTLQESSKRSIGRPKGSRSTSKFDKYHNEIISYIKSDKSVSEIARLLHVSRSSLKDYIESRELKEVASGSLVHNTPENAEETVINKITCPLTTK